MRNTSFGKETAVAYLCILWIVGTGENSSASVLVAYQIIGDLASQLRVQRRPGDVTWHIPWLPSKATLGLHLPQCAARSSAR